MEQQAAAIVLTILQEQILSSGGREGRSASQIMDFSDEIEQLRCVKGNSTPLSAQSPKVTEVETDERGLWVNNHASSAHCEMLCPFED